MKHLEGYLSIKYHRLLILIFSLYIILYFLNGKLVLDRNLFINSYSQQLSIDRIEFVFNTINRVKWMTYILNPFILFLKLIVISMIIYGGIIYGGFNTQISFKKIFSIVIASEIVVVLAGLVKFLWFWVFSSDYTIQDIQYFYPLSAAQFFKPGELYPWLVYPFQVINVFEIVYWFVLAYGLKIYLKKPLEKMLKLVLSSYGVGLLVWVVFVMFLTLNYS